MKMPQATLRAVSSGAQLPAPQDLEDLAPAVEALHRASSGRRGGVLGDPAVADAHDAAAPARPRRARA